MKVKLGLVGFCMQGRNEIIISDDRFELNIEEIVEANGFVDIGAFYAILISRL